MGLETLSFWPMGHSSNRQRKTMQRREIDSNSLLQGSPKNSVEIIFRMPASQHLPAYLIERWWKFRVTDIKQSTPAVPCKTQHEIELSSIERQMKLFFLNSCLHVTLYGWQIGQDQIKQGSADSEESKWFMDINISS